MGTNKTAGLVVMLVGGVFAPACSVGTPAEPDFAIGATAAWSWTADEPADLGYRVEVRLNQTGTGGRCREASASTRLTVDGVDVPLVPDPETGCLLGQVVSPSVRVNLAVTARLEEAGGLVGEVVFDRLTPGTSAALITPPDGRVRAGDDLLIVPPSELPTSHTAKAVYYPLDGDAWLPQGMWGTEQPLRGLDGLHLTAPTFRGRALLIVQGMPGVLQPDVACPGFARCSEFAETTLGPFMLTGVP